MAVLAADISKMIRPAIESDVDSLLLMARAMHHESPRFNDIPFVDEKALQVIGQLTSIGGAFVAEYAGNIIGMLGGIVVEHFFSTARYACDLVVYVKPEHRGSWALIRLVDAFEKWAVDGGASEILLGVSTEVEPERTVKLYKHMGYRVSGHSLIKNV